MSAQTTVGTFGRATGWSLARGEPVRFRFACSGLGAWVETTAPRIAKKFHVL